MHQLTYSLNLTSGFPFSLGRKFHLNYISTLLLVYFSNVWSVLLYVNTVSRHWRLFNVIALFWCIPFIECWIPFLWSVFGEQIQGNELLWEASLDGLLITVYLFLTHSLYVPLFLPFYINQSQRCFRCYVDIDVAMGAQMLPTNLTGNHRQLFTISHAQIFRCK